jgi:hypothetical protein
MARAKRTSPPLSLVPPTDAPEDVLRKKIDALALDLAEKLRTDDDIPIVEKLSGLKVLTEFWKSDKRQSGQTAPKPQSAFDDYRRTISGGEE